MESTSEREREREGYGERERERWRERGRARERQSREADREKERQTLRTTKTCQTHRRLRYERNLPEDGAKKNNMVIATSRRRKPLQDE